MDDSTRTGRADRPRVICHMTTSVDGRIVTEGWPETSDFYRHYEEIHDRFEANGWMCGRVTMEDFAGGVRDEADVAKEWRGGIAREDFRAAGEFDSFAFAVDASGRLAWGSNDIEGDHVVAVLSQRVSDEYLAFLRERGLSYVLAGDRDVDLALALRKIRSLFGIETLMLEGGGRINGSMMEEGLIDELSLLIAPVCDGRIGTPALFDVDSNEGHPVGLTLSSVEQLTGGATWLRFSFGA
jgi:2,5-diamino-6-(ribosylamino)-4(3H)-pyrimidinone 5'-phosphate reductase